MTNLYDFQPLTAQSSLERLMPEALTFGGVNLDKELAGYRTLNVSGRENYTRTVNTVNTVSDGELFVSSKLDSHEITIKYELNGVDIDDFNKKYTRLKFLLQGNEQPFFFADENEFSRYGTVTSLTLDDAGVIKTTGSIVIKMTNPFRNGQSKLIGGTNKVLINDPQLMYKQLIDSITLTVGTATNVLTLMIDNYKLVINGSFTKDVVIVIDFNSLTITQAYNSILSGVDIMQTDIFEAKVMNGSVISCDSASKIDVKYRVRLL